MNNKIKKVLTYTAAAAFLLALAINVKVTLDDLFVMLSDEAVAQTTTTTTNSSGNLCETLVGNLSGNEYLCSRYFGEAGSDYPILTYK